MWSGQLHWLPQREDPNHKDQTPRPRKTSRTKRQTPEKHQISRSKLQRNTKSQDPSSRETPNPKFNGTPFREPRFWFADATKCSPKRHGTAALHDLAEELARCNARQR